MLFFHVTLFYYSSYYCYYDDSLLQYSSSRSILSCHLICSLQQYVLKSSLIHFSNHLYSNGHSSTEWLFACISPHLVVFFALSFFLLFFSQLVADDGQDVQASKQQWQYSTITTIVNKHEECTGTNSNNCDTESKNKLQLLIRSKEEERTNKVMTKQQTTTRNEMKELKLFDSYVTTTNLNLIEDDCCIL